MAKKLTPMIAQYQALKKSLPPDVLLFFHLGDFYELFFEDAERAAPVLGLALTKRNETPMCGVPKHAAENYVAKLLKAGFRVALAEQKGEVKPGSLVERKISAVISQGANFFPSLLHEKKPNYLVCVLRQTQGRKTTWALAAADVSAGEFLVGEYERQSDFIEEIKRLNPAEILVKDARNAESEIEIERKFIEVDENYFDHTHAMRALTSVLKAPLAGFDCERLDVAICAAGALLSYAENTLRLDVDIFKKIKRLENHDFLGIDHSSCLNLELVENVRPPLSDGKGAGAHTMLEAIDRAKTPMGSRLIRAWLLKPLREIEKIQRRQSVVKILLAESEILANIRAALAKILDIERLLTRLRNNAKPRDLHALCKSLMQTSLIRLELAKLKIAPHLCTWLGGKLAANAEFARKTLDCLDENLPVNVKDGSIFKNTFCKELDDLRAASAKGKRWIAELQKREARQTGIKSLKVKYNNVFGYFIEITKANLDLVPEHYIRKQTTANAERYLTVELRQMEDKILGAEERAKLLEAEMFAKLIAELDGLCQDILSEAQSIARIDALAAFAYNARLFGYVCPEIDNSSEIIIKKGRHPVIDQAQNEESFVPNNIALQKDSQRLIILTGPNMAGKSTYLRQVALIVILAQMGSFVPAESARIGVVDKIFTRVGASDDIAGGLSTFMVEMTQSASILNNANENSLIILDEIGRGTATYDGLAIAWSVAEHIHNKINARTLFATHYHELTQICDSLAKAENFTLAVRDWDEEIIFLREVIRGCADRSYGVHVAELAGLPQTVIRRAKLILDKLENYAAKSSLLDIIKDEDKHQKVSDESKDKVELKNDLTGNKEKFVAREGYKKNNQNLTQRKYKNIEEKSTNSYAQVLANSNDTNTAKKSFSKKANKQQIKPSHIPQEKAPIFSAESTESKVVNSSPKEKPKNASKDKSLLRQQNLFAS